MLISCHQPYLFPYKGYFDLIRRADKFIVYDDAKYMKAKYVNRNYFPNLFTFRLKKHSDYAKMNECYFYDIEEDKVLFKRKTGLNADKYLKLLKQKDTLSRNIVRTIKKICRDLGIDTPIYLASKIPHRTSVEGLIDMIQALDGDSYINLPGGKELYNQDMFGDIKLKFLKTETGPSVLCSEELCTRKKRKTRHSLW